jgi:hypothetical protein
VDRFLVTAGRYAQNGIRKELLLRQFGCIRRCAGSGPIILQYRLFGALGIFMPGTDPEFSRSRVVIRQTPLELI